MSACVNRFIVIDMNKVLVTEKRSGRPLSFDRNVALEQAMLLFWRHGYEATSLADLTTAMGVTPPSVYAAFGNKKQLFLEAVGRYLAPPSSPIDIIDRAGSARDAALALMEGAAEAFTNPETPPGCMLATSAISVSASAADVQAELSRIRNGVEAHLRRRIERGDRRRRTARRHRCRCPGGAYDRRHPGHVDPGPRRSHSRQTATGGPDGDAAWC